MADELIPVKLGDNTLGLLTKYQADAVNGLVAGHAGIATNPTLSQQTAIDGSRQIKITLEFSYFLPPRKNK